MKTRLSRRNLMLSGVAASVAVALQANMVVAAEAGDDHHASSGLSPDQALARLIEGNRRFVANQPNTSDISTGRRLALAKGQTPFAALIGCADSRVGPEHLFEAGLGELFIVRTAGNYVDAAGEGSIAYAISALKVPLIVVLGHERCGAVGAALSVVDSNAQLPPVLSRMVAPILPAVISARAGAVPGADVLDACVEANVRRVVAGLRSSTDPIFSAPIAAGLVRVVGARYDLDTGIVDFFDLG